MSFDVKLIIYEGDGQVREIPVRSRRLSIGRGADNDLQINDQGLSRRHLLIDIFDDVVQLTDCGTQNGTMVNRQAVVGSTFLKDGDSILIGYACDIRVQIRQYGAVTSAGANAGVAAGATASHTRARTDSPANSSNLPMIAIGSVIGIFFVAGLLILFLNIGKDDGKKPPPKNIDIISPPNNQSSINDPPIDGNNENKTGNSTIGDPPPPPNRLVEELGAKVLSRISRDKQKYIFRESALRDINQMIERLKSSSGTASAISAVRQRKARIGEIAKRLSLVEGYAVYAVLAESDNRGGDADATVLNDLAFVSTTFGAGTAENAMVSLAAYKEGQGTKKSHPLLARLRRGEIDPQTQRNIWYLHDRKLIGDEQYNFVVRFIALAIIAENPRNFAINTEPLAF